MARPHHPLPANPLADGAAFDVADRRAELAELERWLANADHALHEAVAGDAAASPVRLWPHHFDIATLVDLGEGGRSINLGLSPGDDTYPEPYFYVSPWPYPEPRAPTALPHGHWHDEGFFAAVLTAEELLAGDADGQARRAAEFLDAAAARARAMLAAAGA